MSVLLKPAIELSETPFLTICAAVAVTRAIEEVCGVETGVKWVNDVYWGGKKLCGILTEASISAEMQAVDYAVVGIGINTAGTPPEVRDIATSVYEAAGMRGVRNRLTAGVLNNLERVYTDFTGGGKKREILEAYRERLFITGRTVEVFESGRSYTATVQGVDDDARLIVKRANGEVACIGAGEVKLYD
jgi:BirA family biotin operon repressor/biotin-[acetyl-CoA-carboxylase] ligase